jgi:hypothetical protein
VEEFLQQIKMTLETHMNCEVEVVGESELSISTEENGETKTYTMTVRED